MASPATNRIQWLETVLMLMGIGGLAVITFWNPATSQMHAAPGRAVYWFTLLIPILGLATHLGSAPRWQPPAGVWTGLCLALAGSVLISALMSPHRAVVLHWSAPWLSAIALFFWLHAHLNHRPTMTARLRVHRACAVAATALFGISLLEWGWTVSGYYLDTRSIREVLAIRNSFPLGHSNYVAGAALLGLPWVWRAVRQSTGVSRIGWALALCLGVLTVFTSGSRGGMLGLGAWVGIEILLLQLPWRRLITIGAIAVVLTSLFAISNPRIRSFLTPEDSSASPNISTVQRTAMTKAAWLMGMDRPLLGWGLHATPLVYPRYRSALEGGAENVLQLHGTPQEIWAGLGALGVALVGGIGILAAKRWRADPTAVSALGAYAVFALTDYQADVPCVAFALAVNGALLAPQHTAAGGRTLRTVGLAFLGLCVATIGLLGRRDPTPSLNSRALILATQAGGAQEAVDLLRASIRINPYQEIAHFNLGWLLIVASPETAASHFRAAATLVPDKGAVYFGLGLAQLNAGNPQAAVHSLALECLNDPSFLQSRWWAIAALDSLRDQVREQLVVDLDRLALERAATSEWQRLQIDIIRELADTWGPVDAKEGVAAYRRQRTGYPVLMRNLDLPIPVDLYDVQDPPRAHVGPEVTVPPKGWLSSTLLLKLLDQSSIDVQ